MLSQSGLQLLLPKCRCCRMEPVGNRCNALSWCACVSLDHSSQVSFHRSATQRSRMSCTVCVLDMILLSSRSVSKAHFALHGCFCSDANSILKPGDNQCHVSAGLAPCRRTFFWLFRILTPSASADFEGSLYSVSLLLGRLVGFLVVFLCLLTLPPFASRAGSASKVGAFIACGCLPCFGQWSIGAVDRRIDGLLFFRGMMVVYQDCGVENMSAIEVVVDIIS